MESESSLPYLQRPTTAPNLSQINPIYTLPSYFHTIHFSIILHIVYILQVSLFIQFFPPKPSVPCFQRIPRISSYLILAP
jgi:hypothetical protein